MDAKKKLENQNGFLKTTVPPSIENRGIDKRIANANKIDGAQKAALNRKGNLLFNNGDIETAKRIFITTGYSDGLSRIGDYYKSKSRFIDALQMYWIAPDHTKSEALIKNISGLLRQLLQQEEEPSDE